jgi:hypothetical protein
MLVLFFLVIQHPVKKTEARQRATFLPFDFFFLFGCLLSDGQTIETKWEKEM